MMLFVLFVCILEFFGLTAVADFLNTMARAPISVGRTLFFTHAKGDAVWTGALSVGHGYLSMAVFIFIY